MRTLRRGIRAPLLLGATGLAAWPFAFSSSYDLRLFALAGIYAILVLGYQFIFGHAGAFALTQGAFFGVAAYITGVLGAKLGWSAAATLPLSIIGPVLLALVVAAPVLRLASHYFALATLGIAQIALLVAIKWEPVTGGANGLPGVPGLSAFGSLVPRGIALALVIWGFVALGALFAWRLMRGLYGRAFALMRSNEIAATSIGIDVARLRLAAFLLSAAFAGVAGALYAHTLRVVSPEALEFHVMVACLSMAVVGGRTRIAGAILGAFLLVHLPEWFRVLEGYYLIAYGAALLAMVIAAPDGLIGLLEQARSRFFPEPLPAAPAASAVTADFAGPVASFTPLLTVTGIGKRFGGVEALRDVSFEAGAGEIVGVIGPNGSGKTTLINVITGLYTADRGDVRLAGQDVTSLRTFEIARRGVARTFQSVVLADEMSALDNVAVGLLAHSKSVAWGALIGLAGDPALAAARGHAMRLLEELGVADAAMRPCGGLAHGIRRRIELARALATRPRLLLLDEPAAGLGDGEQGDLARRLKALASEGLTLVVVEHNMPFLMGLADRMLCLEAGKVIAAGTPAAVRADSAVIAAYLGTASPA